MEEKYRFTTEEIMEMKREFNMLGQPNKEVLEEFAFRHYDMKHNGTVTIGKVTKFTVSVVDMP